MTHHPEAIETDVIGQVGDVARRRLVGAIRVVGAVSVAGTIGGDQSHAFLRGDLGQGREETARPWGSMKRDHGSSRRGPILDPRQFATVRKLEDSGVGHGRILPQLWSWPPRPHEKDGLHRSTILGCLLTPGVGWVA
jgi:hypothetical protein